MSSLVFFDVDTQFDFMDPRGTLYVPDAPEILGALEDLMECATRRRITTISTLCSHEIGDEELKQFPPHCMVGSPGQARVLSDLPALPRISVPKGSTSPATLASGIHYIAEKNTIDVFLCPWLQTLSRAGAFKNRECFVFGVATDHCVRFAALGLLNAGAQVSLVTDAVKGLTESAAALACEEMQAKGASLCRVRDVIRRVEQADIPNN